MGSSSAFTSALTSGGGMESDFIGLADITVICGLEDYIAIVC